MRDKIIYFNHKNVCIRNDGRLVYGSIKLSPKNDIYLTEKDYEINIHK